MLDSAFLTIERLESHQLDAEAFWRVCSLSRAQSLDPFLSVHMARRDIQLPNVGSLFPAQSLVTVVAIYAGLSRENKVKRPRAYLLTFDETLIVYTSIYAITALDGN
jgi:anti-sigma-K factor RskA